MKHLITLTIALLLAFTAHAAKPKKLPCPSGVKQHRKEPKRQKAVAKYRKQAKDRKNRY